MKSITKRIISTLVICGALVLEAGAVAFGSLGKSSVSRVDATDESKTFVFTSTTPTGWTNSSTTEGASSYAKMSSGSYIETTSDVLFGSGEVLSSDFKFTVSCGTFSTWSGAKSVKVTGAFYDSSSSVVGTAASQTFSGLSNSESAEKSQMTISLPTNPENIKKFRVTFSEFTTGTTLRFKNLKLVYSHESSSPAVTYTVTYKPNGGTGTDVVDSKASKIADCTFTAPSGKVFDSWNTSSDGNGTKYDVDASVSSNLTLYAIWKDKPVTKEYTLVTGTSDLSDGDEILFACNTKDAVAGAFSSKYLSSVAGTFSEDKTTVTSESGVPFVANKSETNWTFTSTDGVLGTSGAKTMVMNSGTKTWTVSISNGTASVTSTGSGYGSIKYNSSDPRFLNYTSGQTDIQIYKAGSSEPKLSAPTNLKYEEGVLSWTGVANATGYKVSVNEGTATTVTDTSYAVALPQLASVSIIATDSTSTYKDSSAATYLYKNRGSSTNPLSVSDAVKLIEYETGKVNSQYTEEKIYVTGVTTADSTYNSTYKNYDKITISGDENTLTIQRATRSDDKTNTIKAGSTLVAYGYGEYYNGCTLYPKNNDNPVLTSVIGQTYTVSYKPGAHGTGSEQSDVKEEGIALTLKGAIFTRTGYTQTGWSTSDGGAKVYELNDSYTTDAAATLYPFWTLNTYTITYAPGAYSAEDQTTATKTHGVDLTLAGAIFTRIDYKQVGWATSDGGAKVYELEGTYSANAATTLYPVWAEAEKHSVTYVANGATGDVPTQIPVAEGSSFTVASADGLTMEGHNFAGWSDGSTTYAAGSTYTMGTSNVTLTAQWTAIKHSVTYDANGGSGTVPTQADVEETGTFTVAAGTGLSKEHYTFAGWSDGVNTYQPGTTYTMGTVNITLTAHWTANKYAVTFDGNDADVWTTEVIDETYGSAYVLPVNVPTKVGYHFVGWFTEEVGGTQITSSTIVNLSAAQTLYAHFEINVYSVITNAGHSTPESEITELTHGSAYNNTFTAQEGWYIESITYTIEGSESVTVQGNALSIESVTNNLSITVNTVQIVLDHITVSPESVEIDYDGTVNKDNLVVTAFYNAGKDSARVTDFEITGYDNKTPGTYEATVSYTEDGVTKTTTLTVVVANKVVSLEVSGYDTTVDQGKDYVFNGKVVAHYQDGSTIENPEGVEVSKLDTSGHGPQTLKVTYGGVSAEVTINVIQTKTPIDAVQAVAIGGGCVVGVAILAVGLYYLLKMFKL